MKQFIYQPEHLGYVRDWPTRGEIQLDFEITEDIAAADVFVFPAGLEIFKTREDLYQLPYFRGREDRHVFMGMNENITVYDLPCIFLRSNLTTNMSARDENSISIPWPVEDFNDISNTKHFDFDISFHGWVGSETRQESVVSVEQSGLKVDVRAYPNFYGHQHIRERERRRRLYKRSLHTSKLALCPESIPGNIPYRFYEALSAGRVPVLIGSDYVLPFADTIPWNDICIQIMRGAATNTGEILEQWIDHKAERNLEPMMRLARLYWIRYLDPAGWVQSFSAAVRKQYERIRQAQS